MIDQLKENVVRSEGYAQGFKEGYASCARFIVDYLEKQEMQKELLKKQGTELKEG